MFVFQLSIDWLKKTPPNSVTKTKFHYILPPELQLRDGLV